MENKVRQKELFEYSLEKIEQKLAIAIEILFLNDYDLFDIEVNERSISHKLAEYLQILFPKCNVDCEYNRHIGKVKRGERNRRVLPDIVVHQRGNDDNNLLVIELKKKRKGLNIDIKKLKNFTGIEYRYKHGFLLVLNVGNQCKCIDEVKYFNDGQEIGDVVLTRLKRLYCNSCANRSFRFMPKTL